MTRLLFLILLALPATNLTGIQPDQAGRLEVGLIPGAQLTLDLSSGDYVIRSGQADRLVIDSQMQDPAERHKVRFGLEATREEASVKVYGPKKLTATIQIPKNVTLNVRLNGGHLTMANIEGDKDIESNAGRLSINVGHPENYRSVEASVEIGAIDASAFHSSKSGLLQSFNTTGPGKYRLHVHVGTGQIKLFTEEESF